jgi:hypothetical protein
MESEQQSKEVEVTVCSPEERTKTYKVCKMVCQPEKKTETYTVCVPKTTTEEVEVKVCHMVAKQVEVQGGCGNGCGCK